MSTQAKDLVLGLEALEKLAKGIDKVTSTVKHTLGPKGWAVGIEKIKGNPNLTNDGYTIAKDIVLEDQYENMGVQLAQEVASKIKDSSGDGTTTGLILLNEIIKESVKGICSGIDPILIKQGLHIGKDKLLKIIKEKSIPVKDKKDVLSIAKASASGYEDISFLVTEAFEKIGDNGFVSVEQSNTVESFIELGQGLLLEKGSISPYFITDNDKSITSLENPYVLITDRKISSIQELLPILQEIASTGRPLFIICDDMENDILATLVVNKMKGILKVAVIKTPNFGDNKTTILQDIAIFTNGMIISNDTGVYLKNITLENLGHCDRIEVSCSQTTLIGCKANPNNLNTILTQISKDLEKEASDYNKKNLLKRKANLEGKVAIIKVGASTEIELKQKTQIFEDCTNSTKLALASGYVIGGGVALFQASQELKTEIENDTTIFSKELKLGISIMIKACEAPIKQLAHSLGLDGTLVIQELISKQDPTLGLNVNTGQLENLLLSGILDPTKVLENSLSLATSTAGLIVLSEVLIGFDEGKN